MANDNHMRVSEVLFHSKNGDPVKVVDGKRKMEFYYMNTGFPFTVTESFMDLFEGLTYDQTDATLTESMHEQGNTYWSVYTSPYKYGFPGSSTSLFYDTSHSYEINGYTQRLDEGRRAWDNHAVLNNLDLPRQGHPGEIFADANRNTRPEERTPVQPNTRGSQVVWQDTVDPDNMTYEELLELGEAIGTQSRGLSQERIASLPVTKYKSNFFFRKKARSEKCVICQMKYKRGDRQMILPCKHAYHSICVSKWLRINKACPICFVEVPSVEPKHQ